eukprot:10843529-Prorocentrum_lima.AAC.1
MQVGNSDISLPATLCKVEDPKLPSSQLSASDLSLQPNVSSVAQPPRKTVRIDICISYFTSEVRPSSASTPRYD